MGKNLLHTSDEVENYMTNKLELCLSYKEMKSLSYRKLMNYDYFCIFHLPRYFSVEKMLLSNIEKSHCSPLMMKNTISTD